MLRSPFVLYTCSSKETTVKKTALLAFIGASLGLVMAIGVPGVSAEQQAHAFVPCNNSITCQPANMPMLAEAGMIKIGADGLVKTAIATPKVPPGSAWNLFDWVGGVIGAAATVVAGWTTRSFIDANGELGTTDGETMTSEGLPEGQIETAPGHKFTNVNDAKDWESLSITEQYGVGLGVHIQPNALQPVIVPPRAKIGWSSWPTRYYELEWNPVTVAGQTATIVYQMSGDYGSSGHRVLAPGCTNGQGKTTTRWTNNITRLDQTTGMIQVSCLSTETLDYVFLAPGTTSAQGASIQIWSSKGNTYSEPSADTQQGTVERTLDCRDTAGVIHAVSSQTLGTMGNGPLSLAPLKCPPGTLPIDTGTTWKPETGEPITIIPKRVTIPKPITEMEKYPDCWDGKCVVTLERTNGDSCGKIGENCPDWAKDPKRSQNYVCKFGGKLVNLNMCSMYRAPEYGVLPNVDKDTGEYLDPSAPIPKDLGKPVTDPKTGNPMTSAPVNNQPQKDCRPQSFLEMLNPFNVFQAVGCAMKEAFVPKEENIKAMQGRINGQWTKTSVAQVTMAVGSLMDLPAVGNGCTGPPMRINMAGFGVDETFYPFNACAEPMAGVAATVKNIGGFLVVAGGLLAMLRYSARIINYDGFGKHDGSHESGVKFK